MSDETKPEAAAPVAQPEKPAKAYDLDTHRILIKGQALKDRRRRKFMDGEMTPEEAHVKYGVATKCLCGKAAVGHIRSYIEVRDLFAREPERCMAIAAVFDGGIPTTPMRLSGKGGPISQMVAIGAVHPCAQCWPLAAREAAHHPDYIHVELDRATFDSTVYGRNP